MKNSFIDRQIAEAKYNFNYFFMKMIVRIFQNLMKLSIVLLINFIFNYLVVNVVVAIILMYYVYNIYSIYNNYTNILNDIRNTLKNEVFTYEIDINTIGNNLFRKEEKYGK